MDGRIGSGVGGLTHFLVWKVERVFPCSRSRARPISSRTVGSP